MRTIAFFALILLPLLGAQESKLPMKTQLENDKVKISEVTYPPGVPRASYTRPTDQVIVFLDDCKYQRIDSKTGEKTVRERKAGEAIWHDKGDDAPVLINLGSKPYRTLVIEMRLVRKNRGWIRARAACQVSGRGPVRERGRCGTP
ncbi:MAG: hypothetical protein ACR2NN_08200 [Bryobacteraceae bacterium]